MAVFAPFCFFMVALASFITGQASAIYIMVTPELFDVYLDDSVQISCIEMDQPDTTKEILALEIVKGGKPLVVIRQSSQISFTNGNDTRFKAVGHIEQDASKSYLNLVIKDPNLDDAGLYTCALYYMDEVNIIKTERERKTLIEKKNNYTQVETFLLQKVKSLENKLDNGEQKAGSSLRQEVTTLNKKVEELTQRANYTVAFLATTENNIKATPSGTLVLSDVILNQNQGYDQTTGIFTAPRDGIYVFHVTISTSPGCDVFLSLLANDNEVASLNTHGENDPDQATASSTVNLKAGEQVHMEFDTVKGGSCEAYGLRNTLFTGYLIHLED